MSIPLRELGDYLDRYLRVREVPDDPNALNGLQVENRSGQVTRLVAAVDASIATLEGVTDPGTLLLVHHGLFWDGPAPLTGRRFRKLRHLLEHDVALYAAHIPLDVHAEVGNNHVLGKSLGLDRIEWFDSYKGEPMGVQGTLDPAVPREELARRIGVLLQTTVRLVAGGPPLVQRVGVITGAAGSRINAAAAAGLDGYVTGEGMHHSYFDAMEGGVNVFYAGHYATETVGVKALAEHLATKFGIPWEFHHHPTGM